MVSESGYFHVPDGSFLRYARLAPASDACAGTVVLLGGRAEFIEKHEETIAELNRRHFLVYAMDWRGQGLSSRLLRDRQKGHILTFNQYIEDLGIFMDTIVWPNAVSPVLFLAHSMGGHIALRYLIEKDVKAAPAVLVSPMIRIRTHPLPHGVARRLACLAVRAGCATRFIMGAGPYDPNRKPFKNNPLTSDWQRFAEEGRKIAENPDLAIGGVTYGWLCAALESIDGLLSSAHLEEMKAPVLIVGGGDERVVSVPAMQAFCRRLANCRCVVINHARHEILKEAEPMRQAFWSEFDNFVQTAIQN